MEEACQRDPVRCERGWKLFMLLPRMLLHRPPRGGNDSTRSGEASGQCFSDKPSRVLRTSPSLSGEGIVSKATISPVSSGRQALEGEALAPGTDTTLNMLEDPERRPRTPIIEIPLEMMEHWPVEDFALDLDKFARNPRSARKGAAPGPSGMTSEHLRPLLSHPNDTLMLYRMGEQLGRGQVPQVVIEAIRVGRMTALVEQQSPCALNVLNERDAFQQGLLGTQDSSEMSGNEVFVSKRRSQHLDSRFAVGRPDPLHTGARLPAASAICWSTSQARGRIPPAFHKLIFPR